MLIKTRCVNKDGMFDCKDDFPQSEDKCYLHLNSNCHIYLTSIREHLQIIIGNLFSDVNIGMFRFRYLLHATQEFPIESRLNRKSIGSILIHIGTRRVIGTSSDGQNIPTRGIYTISLSLLFIVCSCLKLACPAKKNIETFSIICKQLGGIINSNKLTVSEFGSQVV